MFYLSSIYSTPNCVFNWITTLLKGFQKQPVWFKSVKLLCFQIMFTGPCVSTCLGTKRSLCVNGFVDVKSRPDLIQYDAVYVHRSVSGLRASSQRLKQASAINRRCECRISSSRDRICIVSDRWYSLLFIYFENFIIWLMLRIRYFQMAKNSWY